MSAITERRDKSLYEVPLSMSVLGFGMGTMLDKLIECIRTSTFDSFRKSVKTMLFTQQYGC